MEQDNNSNHSVQSDNSKESERAKIAREHVERMKKLEIEHAEEMKRLKKDIEEDKAKFNARVKAYDAEFRAVRKELFHDLNVLKKEFKKTDIKFDYWKPKPKFPAFLKSAKPLIVPATFLLLSFLPKHSYEGFVEKWHFSNEGNKMYSEILHVSPLEKKLEDYNPEERIYSWGEAMLMYEKFDESDKMWARATAIKLKDEKIFNEEDAKLFVGAIPYWALMKFYAQLYGGKDGADIKLNFHIACTESSFGWRNENEFPPIIKKGKLGEEGPYHIRPETEKFIMENYGKDDVFYNLSKHSEEEKIISSIKNIRYCKKICIRDRMNRDIDVYHKHASGPKNKIRIKNPDNYEDTKHLGNFIRAKKHLKVLPYVEKQIDVCLKSKGYAKKPSNSNYQKLAKNKLRQKIF